MSPSKAHGALRLWQTVPAIRIIALRCAPKCFINRITPSRFRKNAPSVILAWPIILHFSTTNPPALLPAEGYLNPAHPLYPLAIDGVSCTLCHQIQGNNFGTSESYSGGYLFEKEPKPGERAAYGRFAVDENMATVMRNAAGYQPVQSEHVTQSELCAVCHNLYTPYFTNEGNLSSELFPEQTPHLEWLASDYVQSSSCQTCHMPAAEGEAPVANTGSPKRSPFMQHTFIGGNRYLLEILSANPDALKTSATTEQLEQARLLTLQQLQQNTRPPEREHQP